MANGDLPTVCVVIPCFNYGRFVGEAVTSALQQSHRPREVIVVDDGSSDDTEDALQPYLGRITYIRQRNQGVSTARNTGIRAAQGEWIALLDADDLWLPDKLKLQMQCAVACPEVCLIGTQLRDSPGVPPAQPSQLLTLLTTDDFLGALPFGTSSVVARRECLTRAGLFDETRRFAEDREMWLKLSLLGRAARVNVPLWQYRVHPGQSISNTANLAEGYRAVLKRFFALNPRYRHERSFAYAYYCYDTAMSYFEGRARWHSLWHLLRSYLTLPWPLPEGHAEKRFSRAALLLKCLLGSQAFVRLRRLQKRALGVRHPK